MATRQTNEDILVGMVFFSFMAFIIATIDRRTVEVFLVYLALATMIFTMSILIIGIDSP